MIRLQGDSMGVFLICLLLLSLLLLHSPSCFGVDAQDQRGPVSGCSDVRIPSMYSWNSSTITKGLNSTQPPWSGSSFSTLMMDFGSDMLTMTCNWDGTLQEPKKKRERKKERNLIFSQNQVCGFLQTRLNDTFGPFVKLDIDVEWPPVAPPVIPAGVYFQKKTGPGGVFYNDTVGIKVQPVNDSFVAVAVYFNGINTTVGSPSKTVPTSVYGRHLITLIWDNSSLLLFLDGVEVNSAFRRASDKEWADHRGGPNLFISYDTSKVLPPISANTTGPNGTSVIFHAFNMQCVSPFASDCYLKPNPIPGVATCDILTGTWTTPPGPIELNTTTSNSTTGTNSTGEPVLNITSTVLNVNGSIVLGGGVLIEPEGQLNVTGDIIFRGILTLNVSAAELSNGTASIVLVSYQNYTGNFSEIQLVGTPKDLRSCQRLRASADYGETQFAVILSIDSSDCNISLKPKKKVPLAIVLGVVGGIILLAVLTAVVLVVFCRESSVFRRKPRTRTQLLNSQPDYTR